LKDSAALSEPLNLEQSKNLVQKIQWKNTQDNYAHFGLITGHNLQHIEDMILNITNVLLKTKAIDSDPTKGAPNLLYFDQIMRGMFSGNFHPGVGKEEVTKEAKLANLTEDQWKTLIPVGTLQVPRLVYGRGSSTITPASATILTELTKTLKGFPQYYLIVRGNCSKIGDVEANKKLAAERAKSTVDWLIKSGVDKNRIKSDTSEPNGSTTVAFILGQLPY
jgi:flagellar motor protein MotB